MLWKTSLYEMWRSFFAFAAVVDGDDIDVDDDDVDDGDGRHVLLHLLFKVVSKKYKLLLLLLLLIVLLILVVLIFMLSLLGVHKTS